MPVKRYGRRSNLLIGCSVAVGAALSGAAPARGIITSELFNTPAGPYSYINSLIGATTFYSNGFTGTTAIIANIEAGYIWDQQESLTQDTVEFGGVTGQIDQHATWVGSILNSQPPSRFSPGSAGYLGYTGIAYNSTV